MFDILAPALLIMVLRACDVSIGTVKTIFIIENRQITAPVLGFFEATIYVIAASIVFNDLGNPYNIVGFGLGFGLGTGIGMVMAQRLGLGSVEVRMISQADVQPVADALREAGYRLTVTDGIGRDGPVTMLNMTLRKRNVPRTLEVARPWLDRCFVTIGGEPLPNNSRSSVMNVLKHVAQMPWAFNQQEPHP